MRAIREVADEASSMEGGASPDAVRDLIVAADFFTIEAWTRSGLQRFVILFFIELSTRKVEIGGIASSPMGCG